MQSEHQHIDDFFRKKEEEYMPGNSLQQMHWQQMTSLLAEPGQPVPRARTKVFTTRRVIKYLGGLCVVTIVTIILITTAGNKKTVIKKHIATASTPVSASSSPTPANKTAIEKKAIIAVPVATNKSAAPTTTKHTTIVKTIAPVQQIKPRPLARKASNSGQVTQVNAREWVSAKEPIQSTAISIQASEPAKKTDAAALLARFYDELQQPQQLFAIESSRDTIVAGKQGTRLHIPANTFVTATGKPVNGRIRIILKEYYQYEDIVAAKLSTTSNGQQLVTGGMVHISAEANNAPVQIQPGSQIKLTMPAESYDDRMELFSGNTDPNSGVKISVELSAYKPGYIIQKRYNLIPTKNEVLIDGEARRPIPISVDTLPVNALRLTDSAAGNLNSNPAVVNWISVGQRVAGFSRPGIKVKDLRDRGEVVYGKKTKVTYNINAQSGLDKDLIKKEMEARYGYYYDEIKIKSRKKETWRATPFGKVHTWDMIGDSVVLTFEEAVKFKLISRQDSINYIAKVKKDSASFIASLGKEAPYVFMISDLGWINCDRFQNDGRPRIEMTLRLEDGFDNGNFTSHLLFTRYQSVMSGNLYKNNIRFINIPENEPVQFISIGVKDGKVMTCVQPLAASRKEINDLRFEELTPQQFKEKVRKLDSPSIN